MNHVLLFIGCVTLFGCDSARPNHLFDVIVQVVDDERMAVTDASVTLANQNQQTDDTGVARFSWKGHAGIEIPVQIKCPNGWHESPENSSHVRTRQLISIDGKDRKPTQISLECIPEQKEHVVIIQTEGAAPMQVQYMGTVAAQTDNFGSAQFVVRGKPGEIAELTLNTASMPFLTPQMPSRQITLPEHRRFLIFEQTFKYKSTSPIPKRRIKQRQHRAGPRRL